jgi:hypothetical protein
MKKILFVLLVSIVGYSAMAQNQTTTTTTTTHKYYYYPSTNVYWDQASGNYWYYDNGNWTSVQSLPSTVTITKTTPKYRIYTSGDEPYVNNATDMKKYKVKRNGTIKSKPKS